MPIPLRTDFDAQMVSLAAKRLEDGAAGASALALAAIYEGATRTQAAKIGGHCHGNSFLLVNTCSGAMVLLNNFNGLVLRPEASSQALLARCDNAVQAMPAESRMRLAWGRSRISLSAQALWPFSSAMRSCRISISTWGIFRRSP